MDYTGQFLGIKSGEFTTDEGKAIEYYRLYAWNGQTYTLDVFAISKDAVESANNTGIAFGDMFTCPVQIGRKFGTDETQLKIAEWGKKV